MRVRVSPAVPVLVALCTLGGCAAPPASAPRGDPAAVRAAVEAANARVVAALRRGDAEGAAAEFAPDAVMLPDGYAPVRGREAVRELFRALLSSAGAVDFEIRTEELEVREDLAVETGANALTLRPPGQAPTVQRGRYLVVWKRQPDGAWRIYRDIGNDGPAGR